MANASGNNYWTQIEPEFDSKGPISGHYCKTIIKNSGKAYKILNGTPKEGLNEKWV